MRLTIVHDSIVKRPGLLADRGFSCLVESSDSSPVLLDTGAGVVIGLP